MEILNVPGHSHRLIMGDNCFGRIPTRFQKNYTLHVDASVRNDRDDRIGRRAKSPAAVGWALLAHQRDGLDTAMATIGCGAAGQWWDERMDSNSMEMFGIEWVLSNVVPFVPGVAEGKASITIKCDSNNVITRARRGDFSVENLAVKFEWERGHNLNFGNILADMGARITRQLMQDYSTVSPIMIRDAITERSNPRREPVWDTQSDTKRRLNHEAWPLFTRTMNQSAATETQALAEDEGAVFAFVQTKNREETALWGSSSGEWGSLIHASKTQSLAMTANALTKESPEQRVYVTTQNAHGVSHRSSASQSMFAERNAYILRGTPLPNLIPQEAHLTMASAESNPPMITEQDLAVA